MENDNQNQPVPTVEPPQPTPQGEVPQTAVVSPEHKKSKKPLIILLVIIAVLLIGAAVWYFFLRDKDTAQTNQSNSNNQQANVEVNGIAGGSLVFATHEENGTSYELETMALTGNQDSTARQKVGLITQSVVHEHIVALAAEANDTVTVWVSQDGGATYKNMLEHKNAAGQMTYQVTSLVFAADGSALAVALLNDATNTVTEINLADSSTKDLYKSEDAGVFLEAYNKAEGQLVFFEGCYNCDGNTMTELLLRDLKSNTTSTLLETDAPITVAANNKATSLVVEYGTVDTDAEEGIGIATKAPYTITRIDITSGSKTPLFTSNDPITTVGFTADTGEPYFASGTTVTKIAVDKQIVLFESESSPIFDVYYASQEGLVLATGTIDGITAHTYLQESKSYVKLQQSSSTLSIIGAAIK